MPIEILNKQSLLDAVAEAGFVKCSKCHTYFYEHERENHVCAAKWKAKHKKKKIGSTNKGKIFTAQPITDLDNIRKIKCFIQAAFPKKTAARNLAFVTWGFNCNLRGTDLVNIKLEDLDVNLEYWSNLKVGHSFSLRENKTGKVRRVYVNGVMRETLIDWLKIRGKQRGYIFCSMQNLKQANKISPRYYQEMLRQVGESLDIYLNMRTMRVSWARNAYESGVPLPIISEALNHSNERITRRYIRLNDNDMAKAFSLEI